MKNQIYPAKFAIDDVQREFAEPIVTETDWSDFFDGIILPDYSVRAWSGEIFWNEEWNQDIDFSDAFHSSCV